MATYKEERLYFGDIDKDGDIPYCVRTNDYGVCIEDTNFSPHRPDGNFILLPYADLKEFIAFLQSSLKQIEDGNF